MEYKTYKSTLMMSLLSGLENQNLKSKLLTTFIS